MKNSILITVLILFFSNKSIAQVIYKINLNSGQTDTLIMAEAPDKGELSSFREKSKVMDTKPGFNKRGSGYHFMSSFSKFQLRNVKSAKVKDEIENP